MTNEADQSSDDLELATRYWVNRAWRQVRNGSRATGPNDRELRIRRSLQRSELIEAGRDLVEDEKSDSGRNADVADEPPQ